MNQKFPLEAEGRAIVVGERNGDIVAVCAGCPLRFMIDGRELLAVGLRGLASHERGDRHRVLDFFVKTFTFSYNIPTPAHTKRAAG